MYVESRGEGIKTIFGMKVALYMIYLKIFKKGKKILLIF